MDNGVVHKDRKRVVKKTSIQFGNQSKNLALKERIIEYKEKIKELMVEKNIFALENLINELTMEMMETPDNQYLLQQLRLDIIHAQICTANFF